MQWPREAAAAWQEVKSHAARVGEEAWASAIHECGICLEAHVACDCVRFAQCSHTFCRACLSGYFEAQMAEGAASSLLCPEPSCRLAATPDEVRQLLPAPLFEKYEGQLLQTSLHSMRDVAWCPRCEYPAIIMDGEGGKLATCGECAFSFCTECRQSWHGLQPCANLALRWRQADAAGREALRQKHGDRVLEEVQSAEWCLKNTKPCPKCATQVEKNGGCNHITCRTCGYEWCWLCLRGYLEGHYARGSGCEQFSQDFFDEMNLTREDFDAK